MLAEMLNHPITYAFQPIVDLRQRQVHSYEALLRGSAGEPAGAVFAATPGHLHLALDEYGRGQALRTAADLGLRGRINLNFSPRALETPTQTTALLAAIDRSGLDYSQVAVEITESAAIENRRVFLGTVDELRSAGLVLAIDDFGAGYSGLNLLVDFQPDEIKLDMHMIRTIEQSGPRQAIVRAVIQACNDLGIDVIAEGVETPEELRWLREARLHLFQGYLFARPAIGALPEPAWPK